MLLLLWNYKNSDAHFKTVLKNIEDKGYENITFFHSIISWDVTTIEKDIVKYCRNRNRPDGKLLSCHIHQPETHQSSHSIMFLQWEKRKQWYDQTCAKNKKRVKIQVDKLPRGENAEMNIQRLNVRIDQVMAQIQIPSYWQVYKDMLLC